MGRPIICFEGHVWGGPHTWAAFLMANRSSLAVTPLADFPEDGGRDLNFPIYQLIQPWSKSSMGVPTIFGDTERCLMMGTVTVSGRGEMASRGGPGGRKVKRETLMEPVG